MYVHLRWVVALLLAYLALPGGAAAQPREDIPALARLVPPDVGLYVEVSNAADVLAMLADPQLWTTLAELAGQPASVEDTVAWRARIRATTKMAPETAIETLFGRCVAFVGRGPGRAQDAVVLCAPIDPPATLLRRMAARRLETTTTIPVYQLHRNVGAVAHGEALLFGDLLPPQGLFRDVQAHLDARAAGLDESATFAGLRKQLPKQLDGLVYARLDYGAPIVVAPDQSAAPTTLPAATLKRPELPGPLRGAGAIMIGLRRNGPALEFIATSDIASDSQSTPSAAPGAGRMVVRLPGDTLFAWEGRLDFADLARRLRTLPERNVARVALELQQESATLSAWFEQLGDRVCAAVGLVAPGRRDDAAPLLPAGALLFKANDPDAAEAGLRRVVELGVLTYSAFALASGGPALPAFRELTLAETQATLLDLSPLLRETAQRAIGEVHVCWALHDGVLVLASHRDWLERVLRARQAAQPPLAGVLKRGLVRDVRSLQNIVYVRGDAAANNGEQWLDYIERARPEVLGEDWWRTRQPGGGNVRVGIRAVLEAEQRRLRVTQVLADLPADGRVRVGDHIVGTHDVRFRSDDIVQEFRASIQQRPRARWFDLLIERNGVIRRVRLPLPFVDPIQALRRAVAIGRVAQQAIYADEPRGIDHPRSLLSIQLRGARAPAAATQPAATQSTTPRSRRLAPSER